MIDLIFYNRFMRPMTNARSKTLYAFSFAQISPDSSTILMSSQASTSNCTVNTCGIISAKQPKRHIWLATIRSSTCRLQHATFDHLSDTRVGNVFPRLRSTLVPLERVRRLQQPLTANPNRQPIHFFGAAESFHASHPLPKTLTNVSIHRWARRQASRFGHMVYAMIFGTHECPFLQHTRPFSLQHLD